MYLCCSHCTRTHTLTSSRTHARTHTDMTDCISMLQFGFSWAFGENNAFWGMCVRLCLRSHTLHLSRSFPGQYMDLLGLRPPLFA